MSTGAWNVLNTWLQEAKDEDNFPLVVELLKVYKLMPVTIEILKTNNAAKTIKQLVKAENNGEITNDLHVSCTFLKIFKNDLRP